MFPTVHKTSLAAISIVLVLGLSLRALSRASTVCSSGYKLAVEAKGAQRSFEATRSSRIPSIDQVHLG